MPYRKILLLTILLFVQTSLVLGQLHQMVSQKYYQKLKGKIGTRDIIIDLTAIKSDDSTYYHLDGFYYYLDDGTPVSIWGELDLNNNFSFNGKEQNIQAIRQFIGKKVNSYTYEGKYKLEDTQVTKPFILTEDFKSSSFSFKGIFIARDKEFSEEEKESFHRVMGRPFSDMYKTMNIELVEIKGVGWEVENKINQNILKQLLERSNSSSVKELTEAIKEESIWYLCYKYDVIYNGKNFCCLKLNKYVDIGGAHGINYEFFYNYDLKTGQLVKLEDILKPNITLDSFKEAVEKALAEQDIYSYNFYLIDNFALSKGGIYIYHNSDEYSMTRIRDYFIPYTKIKHLLNPSFNPE